MRTFIARLAYKDFQRICSLRATRAHRSVYSAIIMEAMRNSWTDERLDDGFDRVHSEFARVHSEFAQVHSEFDRVHSDLREIRGEMRDIRGEMSSFRIETNARFEHLEGRFDDLQRTLMQVGGGMIVALLGIIATQL